MRRTPLMLLTWVLGTGVAVATGSLGVQLVTSAVTPARVSPLSAPEVMAALATDPAGSRGAGGPAGAPTASAPGPGAAAPDPEVQGDPVAGLHPQFQPPPAAGNRPGPAPEPSDPAPGAARGRQKPGAQAPAAGGRDRRSSIRIVQGGGGVAAVRFEAGRVVLEWARPDPGFEVRVREDGPDRVDVEFRGDGERWSRVRAWWGDGGPVVRVSGGRGGRNIRGGKDPSSSDRG